MAIAFSIRLEKWLKSNQPKTLASLVDAFGEKSFAIVILALMFIPALPIPTGGITHIFEIMVMLLSLELIVGRHTLWLPKRWLNKPLNKTLEKKAIPLIMRRVRWFEKYSRPRYGWLINHRFFLRGTGLLFFALALAAFAAPPFSGLDTFPSLAAVVVSLALILDDALAFLIGSVLSVAGLLIIGFTGHVAIDGLRHLLGG